MNNTVQVGDFIQAKRGRALIAGLVLIAGLMCGACQNSPAGSPSGNDQGLPDGTNATARPNVATVVPTPTSRPFRVIKTAPIVEVTGNEEYHLNNCGGIEEMRRPFSDAAEIWTEVTVSDQATRSDGATIEVSEPMRSELVPEIELAYEEELSLACATVHQTEMVAGAQERFYVTVIWEDRVFAASVSFPGDGLTATAAYTYTQHVPTMGYFRPMPCTA